MFIEQLTMMYQIEFTIDAYIIYHKCFCSKLPSRLLQWLSRDAEVIAFWTLSVAGLLAVQDFMFVCLMQEPFERDLSAVAVDGRMFITKFCYRWSCILFV